MNGQPGKTEIFGTLRPLLHALAYQMLGNISDADDMVQECFLRWERISLPEIRSPKAFLTTVITRLCLNHLQSARVQRERSFGPAVPDTLLPEYVVDPEDHLRLADSLSAALQVMLQILSPVERAVFLLREVFDCDYEEIAAMIDKTEDNCRQILRRARERLASRRPRYEVAPVQQEHVLQQFLQASASGNWSELMRILAHDATLVCDGGDLFAPTEAPIRGSRAVMARVLEKVSSWWPGGALLQTIQFRGHPVLLSYHESVPVSAVFAILGEHCIQHLCIVTCPVRLRTLMAQQDPGPEP